VRRRCRSKAVKPTPSNRYTRLPTKAWPVCMRGDMFSLTNPRSISRPKPTVREMSILLLWTLVFAATLQDLVAEEIETQRKSHTDAEGDERGADRPAPLEDSS